jgi:hypothetical protein
VALAEETVTRAAVPAPEPPEPRPAPAASVEVLEVVEAEIVTMGPHAPSDDEPPPAPRRKRGPKKSKRKAGEV